MVFYGCIIPYPNTDLKVEPKGLVWKENVPVIGTVENTSHTYWDIKDRINRKQVLQMECIIYTFILFTVTAKNKTLCHKQALRIKKKINKI
jgi:hypothetical protein